jgi:hypothetical protein
MGATLTETKEKELSRYERVPKSLRPRRREGGRIEKLSTGPSVGRRFAQSPGEEVEKRAIEPRLSRERSRVVAQRSPFFPSRRMVVGSGATVP